MVWNHRFGEGRLCSAMPSVKRPKRRRSRTFIKAWREFRQLSQERVASRIGISRENYGRIENGKVPYNQDFLELCADALNCSASDLLERDPFIEKQIDELRDLLDKATPTDRRRVLAAAKTYLENKD